MGADIALYMVPYLPIEHVHELRSVQVDVLPTVKTSRRNPYSILTAQRLTSRDAQLHAPTSTLTSTASAERRQHSVNALRASP